VPRAALPQNCVWTKNTPLPWRVAGEGGEEEGSAPHWMDSLMDVLLTLLAQTSATLPSAPLREAVEHVFRVFCDQLTATGRPAARPHA
jgi:hypothetical protein